MATVRWTDALLDRMRRTTDPVADAVMQQIIDDGRGEIRHANALFRHLRCNDEPVHEVLPPAAQTFFLATALPPWADAARIRRGEVVFNTHGMTMVLVLLCSSLPQCYAGAEGAQVLYLTGRMISDLKRRIPETAQFLLDVMQEGGLGPSGHGIRTTQRIRLMHASIRQFIKRDAAWNDAWGAPINQEDLAGTLMAFSHVLLDGTRRLGVQVSDEDQEDFVHCWKVVGFVLGLDDELQPTDAADASALWEAIKRRQFARSAAGTALTAALLEFLHGLVNCWLLGGIVDLTSRYLIGDEVADMLGVPGHAVEGVLVKPLKLLADDVAGIADDMPEVRAMRPYVNRRLMNGLVRTWRSPGYTPFQIPPSLRGSWRLAEP